MSMNVSQLRCFHAVATEMSFTAGAARLNISQPSISVQVKRLEQAYQVELFHRQGRRVELSEAGLGLLDITRQLFQFEEAAQLYLESAARAINGHIRIGGGSPPYVMPIIAELQKFHSGLTFSLEFGNTHDILGALIDNEIDVAVTPVGDRFNERLDYTVLVEDSLVALTSAGHKFAHQEWVNLKDLLEERMLVREEGSATRVAFERLLASAGLCLDETQTIVSREAIKEAVACDLGVSVVRNLETGKNPKLVRLKIECGDVPDNMMMMTEYVICLKKRKNSTVIQAFHQAARATWASL